MLLCSNHLVNYKSYRSCEPGSMMNPKIYISLKKHFASLIENDNTKGALEWPHFYLDGSNFSYQFLLGSNLSPGININYPLPQTPTARLFGVGSHLGSARAKSGVCICSPHSVREDSWAVGYRCWRKGQPFL